MNHPGAPGYNKLMKLVHTSYIAVHDGEVVGEGMSWDAAAAAACIALGVRVYHVLPDVAADPGVDSRAAAAALSEAWSDPSAGVTEFGLHEIMHVHRFEPDGPAFRATVSLLDGRRVSMEYRPGTDWVTSLRYQFVPELCKK